MASLIKLEALNHSYRGVAALRDVDLAIPAGGVAGIVGPDGVGKSTLLSLIAGVSRIQSGSVDLLGGSIADKSHRRAVRGRIGFMPQGLGQNLYGDLSVEENIRFFASLFSIPKAIVDTRLKELLAATDLTEVVDRHAANLSGGMKQKLGLCTILIRDPDLVILDEPTTGVDPLSRRNFWRLIRSLMQRKPGTTVVVATAYMDEAEDFDWLVMMDAGRIVAIGTPADLRHRTGTVSLNGAYQVLLSGDKVETTGTSENGGQPAKAETVIEATDLTRRFGNFTAVDRINLQICRREIFGFIGPNGSGKTTTMKMLTGLLPPTSGTIRILGDDVSFGSTLWRRRLGYMSQSFSLYTELTVGQNLRMHARLFDIPRREAIERFEELVEQFELAKHLRQTTADVPVGIRQRLSLAVAVIHRPELLILDEPTSGVDPLARERLWQALRSLSDERGTTIFVSTHYLAEAARCDRIALMNDGRLLAIDTPAALLRSKDTDDLEEAFVRFVKDDRLTDPTAHPGGARMQ